MSTSALQILDPSQPHQFIRPIKRINEVHDVSHFLTSRAYAELVTFLFQLNVAVFPRRIQDSPSRIQRFEAGSADNGLSDTVQWLRELLHKLEAIIDEAPPDAGPRRFGNVSFRKWYGIVEERASDLLDEHVPQSVLSRQSVSTKDEGDEKTEQRQDVNAKDEIMGYFIGSFGSAQRLDYGTGHELSFLAFLAAIWKLGGFRHDNVEAGEEERGIVLGVIDPYLKLVRRLIKTYNLEPAGSHGVWGLDDHSFLPYIFGSAQFCPAITSVQDALPSEGSIPDAPPPQSIADPTIVNSQKQRNMYFAAIAFITDVKTGPFWEHSPVLFDISGVRAGWAKINKGMLKMYNAEVLSKFPVVQHFPFGSLLRWEGFNEEESNTNSTSHPSGAGIGTTSSDATRTGAVTGRATTNVTATTSTTTASIHPQPPKFEESKGGASMAPPMGPPLFPVTTGPVPLVAQIGPGHESSLPSLNPLTSPLPSSSEPLPAAALPSARPGHVEHAGTFLPAPASNSKSSHDASSSEVVGVPTSTPAQIHPSRPSH